MVVVASAEAVKELPVPVAVNHRPKTTPLTKPPFVTTNVPAAGTEVPRTKRPLPDVKTFPAVRVSVPLTEQELEGCVAIFEKPGKVTPPALMLLIITEEKFAVGAVAKFTNIPVPDID